MKMDVVDNHRRCYETKAERIQLPEGVVLQIVDPYLDSGITIIGRLSQVCQDFHTILSDEFFWNAKLASRFAEFFYHPSVPRNVHPKSMYRATHSLEKRFSNGVFSSKTNLHLKPAFTSSILINHGHLIVGDSRGRIVRYPLPHMADSEIPVMMDLDPVDTITNPTQSGVTALCSHAAGHADGTVTILTGSETQRKQVHNPGSRITSITSIDTNSLVTCSSIDRSLRVVDLNTGIEYGIKRFTNQPQSISSSNSLILVGCLNRHAHIYDNRLLSSNPVCSVGLDDWCLCVEFDPFDPNRIRASDKSVKTFDIRNTSIMIEERHRGKRMISRFKSDGKFRLVSCGLDGHVLVSSLEEASKKPISLHSDTDYILAVDFDRTRLACGGINGKFSIFTF